MQKLLSCLLLLSFTSTIFGQEKPITTSTDYLKKSKNQRTAARVLLYSGLSVFLIAGSNSMNNLLEETPGSDALAVTGLAAAIGSIPLFIAAKRNRNKAAKATVFLKPENNTLLSHNNISLRKYPALAISINL
ncbi:hypothetical protein LK994_09630 [Ferruginibacter lapsinanis]|uniref:hypothetical protein n=1 Tax=Ferruginibacter lapsinanis TaxID=563172 RepID=UPI001E4C0DB6|nr:hypothetical protein [Ferruginibacter lapsinanis]UEG48897.1 hypothetical protein LK994_09630 [Ferruginibacter lapsinanis]